VPVMPPPLVDPEFSQQRLQLFGQRLRRLRTWREFSQDELAKRAGFSRDYVAKLESGRMSPGLLRLWDLADALGIRLPELFENDLPESWAGLRSPGGRRPPGSRPTAPSGD
jgi:transcriptional regulator with XRE-family HTH domain